jgi:hypothetical protein
VWYTLVSDGDGTAICFRLGGTSTVAINRPNTSPPANQGSSIIVYFPRYVFIALITIKYKKIIMNPE